MYTCLLSKRKVQSCDGCRQRNICAGIDFAEPGDAKQWLAAEIARTEQQIARISAMMETDYATGG